MSSEPISYQELSELVENESDLLLAALELSEALFVIPTDGNGLRIRVSAIASECEAGTKQLKVSSAKFGEKEVTFEIFDDYEPIVPQSKLAAEKDTKPVDK